MIFFSFLKISLQFIYKGYSKCWSPNTLPGREGEGHLDSYNTINFNYASLQAPYQAFSLSYRYNTENNVSTNGDTRASMQRESGCKFRVLFSCKQLLSYHSWTRPLQGVQVLMSRAPFLIMARCLAATFACVSEICYYFLFTTPPLFFFSLSLMIHLQVLIIDAKG